MKILRAALLLTAALAATLSAPPAQASVGYELSTSVPSKTLAGIPRSFAVDQASHDIYAAIVSLNPSTGAVGQVARFNSNLTADGVFGGGYYTGVAVNPLTQGFYAVHIKLDVPQGSFGTQGMDLFSSAGANVGSFVVPDAEALPPLATDSTGRVFYPNTDAHSVQIYNSAGVLQAEVTCSGCPGGAFGQPLSVATDSANNLYVADAAPDRVVKLSPSGSSYVFSSLVQSGRGAAAVGVDPSTGDVFVGDTPGNTDYHIVAYNSSGTQFDDFGADLFPDPPPERPFQLAYQMAVDGTTHKLYVGNPSGFYIFEKVTITPPSATIASAGNIGQLTATLNAAVNPKGHAALSCTFELTTAADVGFASAKSIPCSEKPGGSTSKAVSANASGLSPGSSYLYRVTAMTNAGSVTSGSQGFDTLPEAPPTVTAEPPQGVTETAATLRATANSNGGTVSNCHFELGATTSYGTDLPCTGSIPPVSSDVIVSKKTSALTAGTTYHYRLVVTTNAGTTQGDDVEFKTAGSPSSGGQPDPPATTPSTPAPTPAPPPPSGSEPTPRSHRCKKGFHRRRVHGKVKCVKAKHRHRRRHKH